MVRWAWGSRSMRQTVLPISARAAPRLTVVVVLPTPPFWFIRAIVRILSRLRGRPAPSVDEGRAGSAGLSGRPCRKQGEKWARSDDREKNEQAGPHSHRRI